MNIDRHYQGDSLEITVPISASDGSPFPIGEGVVLTYTAWPKHYPNIDPIELTIGSGITVVDQDTSTVLIKVPSGKFNHPVEWLHQLHVAVAAIGFTQTVWQGSVKVARAQPPAA